MSFIDAPKRPRISISGTPRYPYDEYSQPELYRQLYQNNTGGDRSIHVSAVMGNNDSEQDADFKLLKIDTACWPESYDGKSHKCIYNVTQVLITTDVNDPDVDGGKTGQIFGTNYQDKPFGLAIKRQGANNAATVSLKEDANGVIQKTEYPQVIVAFPPINAEFTLKPASFTSTKLSYHQVRETYSPGTATFAGTYPPPARLEFALVALDTDPVDYMSFNNKTIIFVQFLITLLD